MKVNAVQKKLKFICLKENDKLQLGLLILDVMQRLNKKQNQYF